MLICLCQLYARHLVTQLIPPKAYIRSSHRLLVSAPGDPDGTDRNGGSPWGHIVSFIDGASSQVGRTSNPLYISGSAEPPVVPIFVSRLRSTRTYE